MEIEKKKFMENVKNMRHLEEVCNVTLVSEDYERIRAHKVVLASVSTPSGTLSRLITRIHVLNWSISKEYLQNLWYLLCFLYNGDFTVNERNFLKILKKYKKKLGVFFTIKAFVRLVPGWMFDYPDGDSESRKILSELKTLQSIQNDLKIQ